MNKKTLFYTGVSFASGVLLAFCVTNIKLNSMPTSDTTTGIVTTKDISFLEDVKEQEYIKNSKLKFEPTSYELEYEGQSLEEYLAKAENYAAQSIVDNTFEVTVHREKNIGESVLFNASKYTNELKNELALSLKSYGVSSEDIIHVLNTIEFELARVNDMTNTSNNVYATDLSYELPTILTKNDLIVSSYFIIPSDEERNRTIGVSVQKAYKTEYTKYLFDSGMLFDLDVRGYKLKDSKNKVDIYYDADTQGIDIAAYDYDLSDETISDQINLAIKQLPHSNNELLDIINDVKSKLKDEAKFSYDETGIYEIFPESKVGEYRVGIDVTSEEYLGYPQVDIKISKW